MQQLWWDPSNVKRFTVKVYNVGVQGGERLGKIFIRFRWGREFHK